MLRTAENTICFKLFLYKTTCPTYLPHRCGTNNLLPGTLQNCRLLLLTACGIIFLEKFFRKGSSAGISCLAIWKNARGMSRTYRNRLIRPQQAYKACPITAWVLLQNESERIRTFNILPPARSLSNTRFPCARLPFRHTLLNGISAVSNIFFVLCFALGSFLSHSSDYRVLPTLAPFPFYCPQWLGFCSCNATYTL